MINLLKKYWEILVISFFSLTPLLWFKGSEVIIGHDSGFRLNYLDHIRNLFFSWNPVQNFGADWGILKGFLIIQAPETFFSLLFGSLQAGEKISFVLWFLVIGLSMHVFIKSFFPQKKFWIFRISSSLFYMFNFFLLQGWFIAERAKFSLFAALPLTVLIIFKTLSREYSVLKGAILFSFVTFFLNGGGSPPLFGSLLLVFAITFAFLTVVNVAEKGLKELLYSARVLVSFIAGSLMINAYFVLPHLYQILNNYSGLLSSIGGIEGILAWENAVNKFASFTNLFRLQGIPDWYDNPAHPYSYLFNENPVLIVLSFVFILVICVGLFSYRKAEHSREENRLVVLLFTIFTIALIFTAGSHDPLGSLYIFLVKHIPGFAIFRSAFYKFGPTFWFAAIFLTGYFINILIDKYIKNKTGKIFAGLAVIAFVVLYHFPYFTTNFFQFNKPFTTKVSIPPYVYEATDYLNSKESGRILLLPKFDPAYSVDSYVWGFWSLESLPKLSLNSSVIANDNVSPVVVNKLYEAIDQNNETSFMKLAGILGVDRVLWRGDVMYSDRKTTSDNLVFEKNNILGFNGVSLEKQFDEWEIYKIDSTLHLPTFYSSDRLVYANSNPDQFLNLTEKEGNNTTVVFAGDTDISQPFLSDLADKKYIQPSCVLCKTKELEAVKNRIDIPSARLLPSSMFYFLKTLKEDRLLDKYENFPAQRIDADLAFSSMRIAEVASMVFKNDLIAEQKQDLVNKNIAKYKHSIDDALKQVVHLPDQDRNNYLIKFLGYTQVHRDFMDRLRYRQGFSEDTYEDMLKFFSETIPLVEGEIWVSDDNNKRFIFSIDKEGIYNIEFANNEAMPESIMLDGSFLGKTQGIPLTQGQHRLQLQYVQGDNPIFQDNSEFALGNNEKKEFTLNNPSLVDRYVLSFEYKLNQGDNAIHEFYLGNTKKARFDLSRHTEWRTISQELTLSSNPEENERAKIINLSKELDETIFRSFAITRLTVPSVFISSGENRVSRSAPEVLFRQENPTEYNVSVKGATEPYLLILNQGFDKGWRLYEKKNVENVLSQFFSKPVAEVTHFKSNSYANGWYIEKTGDQEYVVAFEPQRIFYIGLFLSILSLVGASLIYVYKIR